MIAVGPHPLRGRDEPQQYPTHRSRVGRDHPHPRSLGPGSRPPSPWSAREEHFDPGSFDGLVQKFKSQSGPVRTIAEGFGGIVDLTFIERRLHVLETSSPATPFAPNDGRVFRIEKNGGRTVIASELNFPVGLALHPDGEALYVSTVGYGQGLVDG